MYFTCKNFSVTKSNKWDYIQPVIGYFFNYLVDSSANVIYWLTHVGGLEIKKSQVAWNHLKYNYCLKSLRSDKVKNALLYVGWWDLEGLETTEVS